MSCILNIYHFLTGQQKFKPLLLSHVHTYSRVKVRVTGERIGGGTSCQSCCNEVMSRGAGFTGRETERLFITLVLQNPHGQPTYIHGVHADIFEVSQV